MSSLKLLAYAKVNLYLAVYDKRPDNFHDIQSVISNISIFDELVFEDNDSLEVETKHFNIDINNNLVAKAAVKMMSLAGEKGVKIILTKNIPVAAGLGGGSADAAAVIGGLNKMWNLNLSEQQLCEAASSLGSDVPFFLRGGTALAEGTGEKITPLASNHRLIYVIAKPSYGILSGDAYAWFDKKPTRDLPPVDSLLDALASKNVEKIASNCANALEEGVVSNHPDIGKIKETAISNGALCSVLSGSGSSVFSIVKNDASAKRVAKALESLVGTVFVAEGRDFSIEEA